MYGFMRGSHLLVRCPKWTPLSSSAFIEITAIGKNLLAFGLRSPHPRQRPRSFDPWHALEGPRACEIGIYICCLSLGRICGAFAPRQDYNIKWICVSRDA